MKKILSIDWDYVTGDCFRQGTCCGYCVENKRFFGRGVTKDLDGRWKEKFKRLLDIEINKNTPIYVAECHANIISVTNKYRHPVVYDFDSHYDFYSCGPKLKCENWIYYLEGRGGNTLQKPTTMDPPNAIFFCRSAPWTPEEMDKHFYALIKVYNKKSTLEPHFIGHLKGELKSIYNGFINTSGEVSL